MAGQTRARAPRRLAASLTVMCLTRAAGAVPERSVPREAPASLDRYFGAQLVGIHKTVLDNGLEVVFNVERGAPVVAVSTTFGTGRSRGAALPELIDALRHRRVAGSTTDYALVRARGAVSYQSAGWEHSTFTQVWPADELPFALWLEGQRLRPLPRLPESARRLAGAAERAFTAILPERRLLFALESLAWAPPASEALGMNLLNDCCFTPERAVLTVTGDFDSDQARLLLADYVSDASEAPKVERAPAIVVPPTEVVSASAVPEASLGEWLSIGFPVAGAADSTHAAVVLAAELLNRLSTTAGFSGSRAHAMRIELSEASGRSLLALHLSRRVPSRKALTSAAVFSELGRLARRPLSEPALAALRKAVLVRWLTQFTSLKQRSELLGRYEVLHGDARLVARLASALARATASDVQRVLATLTEDRAVVIQAEPRAEAR